MADMIQIKNTVVDANNWVTLNGVTFSPGSWKRITRSNPTPGQFSGTEYVIAKSDRVGIENPQFTLRGVINVHDFGTATDLWSTTPSTNTSLSEDGASMVGNVTFGYLQAVWRNMTGQNYIKISFGNPSAQVNWRQYAGTATSYAGTATEIPVEIVSITPVPREDSEGNHFIDYTIDCYEERL